MRADFPQLLGRCALAAFALIGSGAASATPGALAADEVARQAARGGPAIVVIWTPGCLACRKSLAEIERFAAGAGGRAIPVRTVVPDDVQDEAREMVSRRGLTLSVEADGNRLDAASRRVLADRPLAYAIDREGGVAGLRSGLLAAWALEELAALSAQPAR